ncbi:MAG: hypothetical protein R3C03_21115 [Pirellulaceae bacterium]
MDNDNQRRDSEKNSSVLWFILIVLVAVLFVTALVFNQSQRVLSYQKFESLMKRTRYLDPSGELANPDSSFVIVKVGSRTPTEFRLSRPNDIQIGEREIKGTLQQSVITADGKVGALQKRGLL